MSALLSLAVGGKVWTVRLVTPRAWVELATWQTKTSALRGWRAEKSGPGSWRAVTPWIGVGLTCSGAPR